MRGLERMVRTVGRGSRAGGRRGTYALVGGLWLAVCLAGPAGAGVFDPANSTLSLQIGALSSIGIDAASGPGGNPGNVFLTDDGSGGHVLADDASVWSTTAITGGTSLFTGVPLISNLRVTVANGTGVFQAGFSAFNSVGPGFIGPGFGGIEPMQGQAVISVLNGLLMVPVALSNVGAGGTTTAVLLSNIIRVTGAPFNTAPAVISDITTNVISIPGRPAVGAAFTLQPTPSETVFTLTTGGGFVSTATGPPMELHTVTVVGTDSLISASKSGQVTLVSPIRINTNALAGKIPGVMRKQFVFVPEPASLALLLAGAAGLVLLGREQLRK